MVCWQASKQSQIRTNNSHESGQVTIRTLPWHTINPALPQSQCACGSKIEVLRTRNIYHCSPYLSVGFPYISKSFGIFFPPSSFPVTISWFSRPLSRNSLYAKAVVLNPPVETAKHLAPNRWEGLSRFSGWRLTTSPAFLVLSSAFLIWASVVIGRNSILDLSFKSTKSSKSTPSTPCRHWAWHWHAHIRELGDHFTQRSALSTHLLHVRVAQLLWWMAT